MKNITIDKPGKSKAELVTLLEKQLSNYQSIIKENDATITPIADGFEMHAEKKILFKTFFIKAQIKAEDNRYNLMYDTNAPDFKVKEYEGKIVDYLKSI